METKKRKKQGNKEEKGNQRLGDFEKLGQIRPFNVLFRVCTNTTLTHSLETEFSNHAGSQLTPLIQKRDVADAGSQLNF